VGEVYKVGCVLYFMDKNALAVIAISLVVVIFGTSWVFGQHYSAGITANAVAEGLYYRCTDTDVSRSQEVNVRETRFVTGRVRQLDLRAGGIVEKEDRCTAGQAVLEFYCKDDGKIGSVRVNCRGDYKCGDGSCVLR